MAKEGAEVRRAMSGPDITHDEFIAFCGARNREDGDRASEAGESRQLIGEFIERTGMNGKALSWCRVILKANSKGDKGQQKAMDMIASLRKALPMVEAEVRGQGTTEMDFDGGTISPPAADDGEAEQDLAEAVSQFDPGEGADFEGGADDLDEDAADFEAGLRVVGGTEADPDEPDYLGGAA